MQAQSTRRRHIPDDWTGCDGVQPQYALLSMCPPCAHAQARALCMGSNEADGQCPLRAAFLSMRLLCAHAQASALRMCLNDAGRARTWNRSPGVSSHFHLTGRPWYEIKCVLVVSVRLPTPVPHPACCSSRLLRYEATVLRLEDLPTPTGPMDTMPAYSWPPSSLTSLVVPCAHAHLLIHHDLASSAASALCTLWQRLPSVCLRQLSTADWTYTTQMSVTCRTPFDATCVGPASHTLRATCP